MREGYWINYERNKVFDITEHEDWIRSPGNAKKLGVPNSLIGMFGKFKPKKDRDKFLLFLMQNAPIMRVRGHGGMVTFEYSSRSKSDPIDSIFEFCKENAGPFTQLNIINFATKEQTAMYFHDFEEKMNDGGYDAVMRVATSKFVVRKSVVADLLSISKELLSKKS